MLETDWDFGQPLTFIMSPTGTITSSFPSVTITNTNTITEIAKLSRRFIALERTIPTLEIQAQLVVEYLDSCIPSPNEQVTLCVTDANGNPVTNLTLNDEGWPMLNDGDVEGIANPLQVTAVFHCPTNNSESCDDTPIITIDSNNGVGRVYWDESMILIQPEDVQCVSSDLSSGDLFSYQMLRIPCTGATNLIPGQTVAVQLEVWVQPSEATTLQISADWDTHTANADPITVAQADIYPAVFLHGILGSMPPRNSVITKWPQNFYNPDGPSAQEAYLDPFLDSYTPLIENLLKMGYELEKTLFPTTYDWRQSNTVSASHLHDVLQNEVQNAQSVPYVRVENGLVKANVAVHSMGGLVARTYASGLASDGEGYTGEINKIVFIATPHRGFPATYNTWEGLTWYEYLSTEIDNNPVNPDTGLRRLMDNVVWPYFVIKQYDPALYEPCNYPNPAFPSYGIGSELSAEILEALERQFGTNLPGSVQDNLRHLLGGMVCPRLSLYDMSHHPTRGIGSLPEMLPPVSNFPEIATRPVPDYLSPQSWGTQENPLLEGLGLNGATRVNEFKNNIGLENIYVVYGTNEPTPALYPVVDPPSWPLPWPWQGRWQNGMIEDYVNTLPEPNQTPEGDNLIPQYSTRLWDNNQGLLPDLPFNQEIVVVGDPDEDYGDTAGHKALAYSDEAQQMVAWAFAGVGNSGRDLPFLSQNQAPLFAWNNGDVMLVFLVWSPVDVQITDPQGRRIGYDAQGGSVNEIEGSFYSGRLSDEEFFILPATEGGSYEVETMGTGNGPYAVTVLRLDEEEVEPISILQGVAESGVTETHQVAYTPADNTLFHDDLESGTNDWLPSAEWQLNSSVVHRGSYAWQATANEANIAQLTLLPTFDLTNLQNVELFFWHQLPAHEQPITATIQISTTHQPSWTTVWHTNTAQPFWRGQTVSLTAWAGQADVQLRFVWQTTGEDSAVWYIDDVSLWGNAQIPTAYAVPWADKLDALTHWQTSGLWQSDTANWVAGDKSWRTKENQATLTLAAPLDLSETTNPQIWGWSRWYQPLGNRGIVEVSNNGGSSWQAVGQFDTFTLDWKPFQLSLADYAGQQIQLRFRLDAPNAGPISGGWWLDDLLFIDWIDSTIHPLPFTDGMETETYWQATYGWQPTAEAHSGNRAYRANVDGATLRLLGEFDLTDVPFAQMRFYEQFDVPEGSSGELLLSGDGGLTWQAIYTRTASSNSWEQAQINLTPFAGQTVQFAYHLQQADVPAPLAHTNHDNQLTSDMPWEIGWLSFLMLPVFMAVISAKRWRQLFESKIVRGLLVIGAVYLILTVCVYPFTPMAEISRSNELDEVRGGNTTLVVPSESGIWGSSLSPNNRWLIWSNDKAKLFVRDLTNNEEREITNIGGGTWVNENFLIQQKGDHYNLVEIPTLAQRQLPIQDVDSFTVESVERLFSNVRELYAVEAVGRNSAIVMISLDPKTPIAFEGPITTDFLSKLELSIVYVPRPWADDYEPHIAPNGRYYAQGSQTICCAFEVIDSETGEQLAFVRRDGRHSRIMGWSPDSSTLYFKFEVGGASGSILHPYEPVFKLVLDAAQPSEGSTAFVQPVALQTNHSGWTIDDVVM